MTDARIFHLPRHPLANRRILMTVDSVGGVWRYAMDLAVELRENNVDTVFAGFGPEPSREMAEEARAIGALYWCDAPLDWMAAAESELAPIPEMISELVAAHSIDLVHLNLPSQAAGLSIGVPVVSVAHSCVVTWFDAVRGANVPADWQWQRRRNLAGFLASHAVVAPSSSHAEAVRRCYGLSGIDVVPNASRCFPRFHQRQDFVFAAARWWDAGKNGAVLDLAAAMANWPVIMAGATDGPNGETFPIRHARDFGHLDHASALALMARAAIVVSPSLYEPFGLAALEAARMGAALILADIPTYRELWAEAALFFDPCDPAELARTINTLAADPAQQQEWGRRALLRSRKYTPRRQTEALLRVYEQALSLAPVMSLLEQNA